jgi:polar amino acid transport system permease protein
MWEALLDGAWVTVQVTALAAPAAAVLALVAGLARHSSRAWVRLPAALYVETFRGSSALVQMYVLYFALPAFGFSLSALGAGAAALALNSGSYGSEVVRGAIVAVPRAQIEAAVALNMSPFLRMRRVVLPQAFVAMLPPIGNLLIELIKGTALVSLITLADLTFQAQLVRSRTGDTLSVFAAIMVMYLAMAFVVTLAVRAVERRVARGRDVGRRSASPA